jgi:hypothetical protein
LLFLQSEFQDGRTSLRTPAPTVPAISEALTIPTSEKDTETSKEESPTGHEHHLSWRSARRAEANARNMEVPFAPDELDAIILSHAHVDHSGRLPLLARLGFDKPVYTTPATRDRCAIMLDGVRPETPIS